MQNNLQEIASLKLSNSCLLKTLNDYLSKDLINNKYSDKHYETKRKELVDEQWQHSHDKMLDEWRKLNASKTCD